MPQEHAAFFSANTSALEAWFNNVDADRSGAISVAELQEVGGKYIRAVKLLEQGLQSTLKKNLVTNVSAAIGAVLAEAGVPSKMMRGVILTARCAGLVGHLFEEMNNPAGHPLWIGAQEAVDYQAS